MSRNIGLEEREADVERGRQGEWAGPGPETIRPGAGGKRGLTGLFEDFRDIASLDKAKGRGVRGGRQTRQAMGWEGQDFILAWQAARVIELPVFLGQARRWLSGELRKEIEQR